MEIRVVNLQAGCYVIVGQISTGTQTFNLQLGTHDSFPAAGWTAQKLGQLEGITYNSDETTAF